MEGSTKQKVITLCGSTKFKEAFIKERERLILEGNIVLTIEPVGTMTPEIIPEILKTMLIFIHKMRILVSDEVFVINPDNYIGESTSEEIRYAKEKGVVVKYMVADKLDEQ